MRYDFVVVGAGLFGSALARELTDRGKKVLVVDSKPHIGGACYTERREGILVHVYGPHVFHTNDEKIWAWANRFTKFRPFMVRTKGISQGRVYTLPINLMTLNQMWGVVTPEQARKRLAEVRVKVDDPDRSIESFAISQWGYEIYDKFILSYSIKQWGRDPDSLPASILKRLPVRLTYDDNYFTDRYQGVPVDGYTPMFEQILKGIDVSLEVDFFEDRQTLESAGQVIYSGRIDRFFNYAHGQLEFRSCHFQSERMETEDLQGTPVLHWLDPEVPYTRTIEHKHFDTWQMPGVTVVTREQPFECGKDDMPLYPINDTKNEATLAKYLRHKTSAIFGGRLGSYRYRDMHQVIGEAIALAGRIA